MKERLLLIPFFGNYIINNVVAGIVSLVPATQGGGYLTPQYITFVILALIAAALFAWWYMARIERARSVMGGLVFGVSAFVISIATTFVSGISGVLLQTGSFAQLMTILPNFGPFLMNWSTLILLGYWVIAGVAVGWWLQRKEMAHGSSM